MSVGQLFLIVALAVAVSYTMAWRVAQPLRMSSMLTLKNSQKDEQTIKDLNLEEMFEVFEAADKSVPSSAIGKPSEPSSSSSSVQAESESSSINPILPVVALAAIIGAAAFALNQ